MQTGREVAGVEGEDDAGALVVVEAVGLPPGSGQLEVGRGLVRAFSLASLVLYGLIVIFLITTGGFGGPVVPVAVPMLAIRSTTSKPVSTLPSSA